jgi:hypothetical protein
MKRLFTILVAFLISVASANPQADAIIAKAQQYTYVRESKGANRSKEIDAWNKLTGAPMGSPYCASYISFVHKEVGVKAPISAWSPDLVSKNNVRFENVTTGDVGGIYFPSKGRVAHVFLVEKISGNNVYTVEANTSPSAASGSATDRDGDGVHRKIRSKKLLSDSRNKYSRYWK